MLTFFLTRITEDVNVLSAGSTDTVAVSTNGVRDPITAALHILLGDRLPLDVVRVTAWDYQHEVRAQFLV